MRPYVSIVTPAYNRADYLNETIQSVLSQDYPRIEYIILDDGSTDKTCEILRKYEGRIIWETHANMGETHTVNKGWGMAHGDFIITVNSDDPLLPGAITAAVQFMIEHPDVIVGYPDWNMIGPKSELIEHRRPPEYNYILMLKRHYCFIGPGAIMRRKVFQFVRMRDPDFKYVADFEFWLRVGLYCAFARIPMTLATFRVHPSSASVSQQGGAMAEEHLRLVEKLYSRPDLPDEVLRVRSEAFAWANYVAGQYFVSDKTLTRELFFRALHHSWSSFFSHGARRDLWRILSVVLPEPAFAILSSVWCAVRPVVLPTIHFITEHFSATRIGKI